MPTSRHLMLEFGDARIEVLDLPPVRPGAPAIVLLHEGLGSVQHWRDFPARLAASTGRRCVAYSRQGFGRSSPRRTPLAPDFMHVEAQHMLPALCERLGLERPVLLGHSTGASMALIHAASCPVAGVIAMAPIVFVEESNLQSIRQVRADYPAGRLRSSLARYHDDPDAVFHGWADTWLAPAFRSWSIEACLPSIDCPILAIRGRQDEYVTPAQVDRLAQLAQRAGPFHLVELDQCGHAPHRDQADAVLGAIGQFLRDLAAPAGASR